MSSRSDRAGLAVAALLVLAAPSPASACGPDFPTELLAERGRTLLELPEGVFLDEVAALVPAPAPYRVVASTDDEPGEVRTRGTAAERARYDEGAAAFRAGAFDRAERAFVALLGLPADERRVRSTWAAYMLGRLRGGAQAIAAYRQVRALVDEGFLDDLGLAASSLGQEARLRLWNGEVVPAVELYAQQAALGHPDGGVSLLFVVRQLIAERREGALLADPVGQRLLALYVRTRGHELEPGVRDRLLGSLDGRAGADQLAAVAYRAGEWERAAALVARADDSVTARWVRAKLALRAGDRTTAERLLASLEPAFPPARPEHARVCGERALVAIADGRYPDALAHAWDARRHHPDAIFVAERLVTLEELARFVAELPESDESAGFGLPEPSTLRELLGRRLMREGRYAEAAPFLSAEARLWALLYAGAERRAREAEDPIEQARALYEASRIARREGLAIFGTSHAPDWGMYDAEYEPAAARDPAAEPWRGPGETQRRAASAPPWPDRFHYRQLASHLAEAAANRLPHQSQAFAAMLCWSARHVFHRDPERARALWRRQVKEGPLAANLSAFGQECPQPELDRARRYLPSSDPGWTWLAFAALGLALAFRRWRR